jgi:hypothetical protein
MINSIGMRNRKIPLERKYSTNPVTDNGSPGMVQGCRYRSCMLYPCTKTSRNIAINDQNLNFELVNGSNAEEAMEYFQPCV